MIVKADLHVHSAASWDGRSNLAALAQAAHARGLDAIAVCDHDVCTDVSGEFPVLLIPGVEVTSTAGHILGLFVEGRRAHAGRGDRRHPRVRRACCSGTSVQPAEAE